MNLFMRNECNSCTGIIRSLKLDLRLQLLMLRIVLVLLLLLLLLPMRDAHGASVAATNTTCKHATNMWGDPNPNIFYVCSVADQKPMQLHCPQGRGFFNGLGHLGCIPYDQWPACRPTAAELTAQLVAGCKSSEANIKDQPWATLDPNQFYICPSVGATPLLFNCANGKGFIHTVLTVGCANWKHWRRQMQCDAYY